MSNRLIFDKTKEMKPSNLYKLAVDIKKEFKEFQKTTDQAIKEIQLAAKSEEKEKLVKLLQEKIQAFESKSEDSKSKLQIIKNQAAPLRSFLKPIPEKSENYANEAYSIAEEQLKTLKAIPKHYSDILNREQLSLKDLKYQDKIDQFKGLEDKTSFMPPDQRTNLYELITKIEEEKNQCKLKLQKHYFNPGSMRELLKQELKSLDTLRKALQKYENNTSYKIHIVRQNTHKITQAFKEVGKENLNIQDLKKIINDTKPLLKSSWDRLARKKTTPLQRDAKNVYKLAKEKLKILEKAQKQQELKEKKQNITRNSP